MVSAGEKGRVAQVDAITDAWNRVVALEEEWQDLNGEMCFTPDEREDEPLWQELKRARERLRSIQAATSQESRAVKRSGL